MLKTNIDEAAIFRIEGAFELLKDKVTPINIIAQLQGTKNYSVEAPYIRNDASQLVYPINILNINLKGGAIAGYTWQNVCGNGGDCQEAGKESEGSTCKTEKLETTLHLQKTGENVQGVYEGCNEWIAKCQSDFTKCDPRIVVNWSGTDGSGKYMRSGNIAPGMFVREKFDNFHKSMVDGDLVIPDSKTGIKPEMAVEVKALFEALK